MVHTEHVYTFSAVGAAFTKKTKRFSFQKIKDFPATFSDTILLPCVKKKPHLEYSGGQSATSVRIHIITCDGKLKEQVLQDYLDWSSQVFWKIEIDQS